MILRKICDIKEHFRPEELVGSLREAGYRISLPTLYRNLPLLEQAGIVRKVPGSGAAVWYEHIWGREHHDHLVCNRCGRRVEFSYPAIEVLQEAVAREHGFELRGHRLELFGVCRECKGGGREEESGQ